MTKKRMRAASTLLGCVLALASSGCNNDESGGPTDSGLPDAGDAARPDAGDGSTPDAGDGGSVPQTAAIRLAHLAYGYGSGTALDVHVCLKYSTTGGTQVGDRVLVTEKRDGS